MKYGPTILLVLAALSLGAGLAWYYASKKATKQPADTPAETTKEDGTDPPQPTRGTATVRTTQTVTESK